jgi:hypothetical protein
LPNGEKGILSSKGSHIQIKVNGGKTKLFENRTCWVDEKSKPITSYIAQRYTWNKVTNQTDLEIFFRPIGSKEEIQLSILEKDEEKNIYTVTLPNKTEKYKIEEFTKEYERYFRLTSPNGITQEFRYEP